jgi:hypothetical protein
MARAAYACRDFPRALVNLEAHIRSSSFHAAGGQGSQLRDTAAEETFVLLQQIFNELGDIDGAWSCSLSAGGDVFVRACVCDSCAKEHSDSISWSFQSSFLKGVLCSFVSIRWHLITSQTISLCQTSVTGHPLLIAHTFVRLALTHESTRAHIFLACTNVCIHACDARHGWTVAQEDIYDASRAYPRPPRVGRVDPRAVVLRKGSAVEAR